MRKTVVLVALALGAAASALPVVVRAQTTIETDGDVQAQGFIGDGSQVTNVDAATLDGNDSSDFAGASETAAEIAALQVQLQAQFRCLGSGQRYLDRGDGTIFDCNTGLIWLKNANCFGQRSWYQAESDAAGLASGHDCDGDGVADLTDGSVATDWRQPTISELCSAGAATGTCPSANAWDSLIDSSLSGSPKVVNAKGDGQWSEGDAFVGVRSNRYWSATEATGFQAWCPDLGDGIVYYDSKIYPIYYVWPVRGGQ